MIAKIVTLFLVFIAVLGIFGKLRTPKAIQKLTNRKCRDCGRYQLGRGPCPCKTGKG